MTFVYPSVSYCCETWALGTKELAKLDAWWMKLMRRIAGVTKRDRVRSREIHKQLGTTWLSRMIDERRLRYLGHIMRYPETRWVKFALEAERPTQDKTGKAKQWKKKMTQLLKKYKLTLKMTQNKDKWRAKLQQLFHENLEL